MNITRFGVGIVARAKQIRKQRQPSRETRSEVKIFITVEAETLVFFEAGNDVISSLKNTITNL